MTFSEFNRIANELATRYDPVASVLINIEHWTHRHKHCAEESRTITYSATWCPADWRCESIRGLGTTPEKALDHLAAQLAAKFPAVESTDPLAEIDAEVLHAGSEAAQ